MTERQTGRKTDRQDTDWKRERHKDRETKRKKERKWEREEVRKREREKERKREWEKERKRESGADFCDRPTQTAVIPNVIVAKWYAASLVIMWPQFDSPVCQLFMLFMCVYMYNFHCNKNILSYYMNHW